MDPAELGSYLAGRRARVRPADVGLPPGTRRRVPGLRRDEVARLAGVPVEEYADLEQGRAAQPAPQVLEALARVLRLGADERDRLFLLAGHAPPSAAGTTHVQPAMLDLLHLLGTTPARVVTDLDVTLAQNDMAEALLGDGGPRTWPAASFVHRWFTDPASRGLHPAADHPRHSRELVADLRAAVTRRGTDDEAGDLVARLRAGSAEFRGLWDGGDPAVLPGVRTRIVHPSLGVVELDRRRVVSDDGRQRLVFYTAPGGSHAAGQLELLSVVGRQEWGTAPP